MIHTYEVFVDIREYLGQNDKACRNNSTRYEIDADSRTTADYTARYQARHDFPRAAEYDVRVTRLLK
jgi:hypothetical protein